MIGLRSYQSQDLEGVLRFVGDCGAAADFCGCLHHGDVIHFMSNLVRGRDLDQHLHIYEADGAIQAIILLYPPRYGGFNIVVDPARRGGDLERMLLEWAGSAEWALLQAAGSAATSIGTDVMDCDPGRQQILASLGFQASAEPYMMFTMRSLQTPLPEAILLEGFTIRNAAGEDEAEWVSEAHSSAFGSNWTADEYLRVMRTPGFDIERELVVAAPDGRCAAFLIYWIDPVTRSGLFEPVGCHADFQRRGLTRALMVEGMRRMIARGAIDAIVLHTTDNPASTALYRSVGFVPKYALTDFRKTMA
ncbi:MAG: GNAT family N-acetyltransferase [Chloroflexi bacterium]|nr:GNAT family N-acetyltransferase [Chloroflexota bacterium]